MYNSLFWSISPQDAVTQGGFLVDIVDDDILDGMVTDVLYVRSDGAQLRTLFDSCMCRDAELSCYGIFQKLDLKYFSREVCIACMQSKRVRRLAPSDLR